MEIVDTVKAKSYSGNGKAKTNSGGRVRKRKCLTKEENLESKRLFKEINMLCRSSKGRPPTEVELKRFCELRQRLMELRVI